MGSHGMQFATASAPDRPARFRTRLIPTALCAPLALVLQFAAPALATEPLGADTVWLLDNLDPDYESPPFGDTLVVLDGSGQVVMTTSGINHTQKYGGDRVLAVEPEGRWAILALEGTPPKLMRIGSGGQVDWTTMLEFWPQAVALAADGFAYVLDEVGTEYGNSVFKIDPVTGDVSNDTVPQGGFDLVVDSPHDRVWIVGADIKMLRAGDLALELAVDPIDRVGVSVDYTADGSAWVAERDAYGSGDGLLKVSPNGAVTNEVALDSDPSCVAVDRSDDSVWITTFYPGEVGSLRKYDGNGDLLLYVSNVAGWTVRLDPSDRSVWVSEMDGTVSHFANDGTALGSIPGLPGDPFRQAWLELPSSESITTACNDGQDNDQDGAVDYPEDLDCIEPLAKSENPHCADGVDNDGDGNADYPADPGCSAAADLSEEVVVFVPAACMDGIDNDSDGFLDRFADPGCDSFLDASERSLAICDDGIDNDGDGYVDFPEDPACQTPSSGRENPQCQDGLNNDNQAGIDFDGGDSLDINPRDGFIDAQFNAATPAVGAADPQCIGTPWKNKEKAGGCGVGFEVVFLAPVLARLARRRRA